MEDTVDVIVADDVAEFASFKAFCEHYLEKIDSNTCVEFPNGSHPTIRVYASNLAASRGINLKTRRQGQKLIVWTPRSGDENFPNIERSENYSADFNVRFDNLQRGIMLPYENEKVSSFIERALAKLEMFEGLTIVGIDNRTARVAVYNVAPFVGILVRTRKTLRGMHVERVRVK